MKPTFNTDVEAQYQILWDTMVIKDSWKSAVYRAARSIVANKDRYEQIEDLTNVPWYFIGIIHKLEADLNFTKHLHNGDPLTRRTRLVPAGRPVKGTPPFTFNESAVDALTMKGFHQVKDWSPAHICFMLERYNGWGYRAAGKLSPYLWSGSNHYTKGKFIADHKYSASAVSEQVGGALLLKAIFDVVKESKPEFETVLPQSRRLTTVNNVKNFFRGLTLPFGLSLAFLQDVKEFASDHAGLLLLGAAGITWIVFEYLQYLNKNEVAEGRYQVKGQEKNV